MSIIEVGNPRGHDQGDAPADDWIPDFENALEASVKREAAKIKARYPASGFAVSDCEVTCIPDGDLVRVLVSMQTEVLLRRDQVADVEEGIASLGGTHSLLWASVR